MSKVFEVQQTETHEVVTLRRKMVLIEVLGVVAAQDRGIEVPEGTVAVILRTVGGDEQPPIWLPSKATMELKGATYLVE
jgi:hypothetical protein